MSSDAAIAQPKQKLISISSIALNNSRVDSLNAVFEDEKARQQFLFNDRFFEILITYSLNHSEERLQARSYLNFGIYLFEKGNYENAMMQLIESIRISESNQLDDLLGDSYNQLSRVYYMLSIMSQSLASNTQGKVSSLYQREIDLNRAENYARKAIEINLKQRNVKRLASNYNNLGLIKQSVFQLDSSEYFYMKSIELYSQLNDLYNQAITLNNLGVLYQNKFESDKELKAYQQSLEIFRQLKDLSQQAVLMSNIAMVYFDNGDCKRAANYATEALIISENINDLPSKKDILYKLSLIYNCLQDCNTELYYLRRYLNLKDSIFSIESRRNLEEINTLYETEKKENQIMLLNQESEFNNLVKSVMAGGLLIIVVIALLLYRNFLNKKKANLLLTQQNEVIEAEKKKSDDLLLNILPIETAKELKEKGYSEARYYDQVTILFTDFKGFTTLSEKLSPAELVEEIDYCFKAFDHIVTKYGIEKIKTIGDSYMAAGGLPKPFENSVENTLKAAIEMRDFINDLAIQRKRHNRLFFEVRVGVHTGSVVAGIVGIKKFAYDVWGDTVNTASRMESSSQVGKVNISGNTYRLIKDNPEFEFERRGEIAVKGKGDIEMYFAEFSKG
jgi:adenylate cyclase